jgi:hypothetical protein
MSREDRLNLIIGAAVGVVLLAIAMTLALDPIFLRP